MAEEPVIRQYCVLPAHADLYPVYQHEDFNTAIEGVQRYLYRKLPSFSEKFEVIALPTRNWSLHLSDIPEPSPPPSELVISLLLNDENMLVDYREAIHDLDGTIGADIAASPTEYWCPAGIDQLLFGNREASRQLINANMLKRQNLEGDGVNVVVVDHGLDLRDIPPGRFGGGWSHMNPATGAVQLPGQTRGEDAQHGRMMVRNILDAAPHSRMYDFPLIPPRIWNINLFVSDANAAFNQLLSDIGFLSHWPQWSGPWVLVNPWAIFDRRPERPLGDYTDNLAHPLNLAVTRAVNQGLDVVFCAGNCGQFCPDQRCGPRDQGPGQSIFGANSHPRVISVGAVRVDTRWHGYSSQGPGQTNMAIPGSLLPLRKPDLCAPSNFSETHDAYTANTGTSAACGVTAGVVAALRSKWKPGSVSPDMMRVIVSLTARQTEGPGWNGRLGNGILNVDNALQVLANIPP